MNSITCSDLKPIHLLLINAILFVLIALCFKLKSARRGFAVQQACEARMIRLTHREMQMLRATYDKSPEWLDKFDEPGRMKIQAFLDGGQHTTPEEQELHAITYPPSRHLFITFLGLFIALLKAIFFAIAFALLAFVLLIYVFVILSLILLFVFFVLSILEYSM